MVSAKGAHISVYSEFVVYFSVLNINPTYFFFPFHLHYLPSKTKILVSLKISRKKTCLSLKHVKIEMEIV